MLYLGFLFTAIGSAIVVYGYTERLRAVKAEYAATLKLLVYLRGAVTSEMRTPSESILRFLSEGGEGLAWASGLRTEEQICALLRSREISNAAALLSLEDRAALSDFFFELGRTELSEERARLDRIISVMEKRSAQTETQVQGRIRSAWVLFGTAALGALILII